MRKLISIGLFATVMLLSMTGVLFAQEATDTPDTQVKAWLGVAVEENEGQVVIARVQSASPAQEAGLLEGDIITSVDGTAVTLASELSDLVQAAAPGDVVTLEIVRDGETQSIEVTLGTAPARGDRGGRGERGFDLPTDVLSAVERLVNADVEQTDAGFEVTTISDRGSSLGLEVGDVVTTINGQNAAELDTEALVAELAAADSPTLTVVVTRAGEEVTLTGEIFSGRGGRGFGGGHGDGHRSSSDLMPTQEAPAEATPEPSNT